MSCLRYSRLERLEPRLCLAMFQFFPRDIEVTENPGGTYSVDSGDVDNDGDLDLLVTSGNLLRGKLSWYENVGGKGTFKGPTEIVSDIRSPVPSVLADLDGDGDLDALGSHGSRIFWNENLNGAGDFGPESPVNDSRSRFDRLRVGDLDGDGDLDILSGANWQENVDGHGSFQTRVLSERGSAIGFPLDVDGDQDLDILTTSAENGSLVWRENLDGQADFGQPQSIGDQERANRVSGGDLDGDGDADVLVAELGTNTIYWYENIDGRGSFSPATEIASDVNMPEELSIADLDNDGDADLLSVSRRDGKLAWYENIDGRATFGEQRIIHRRPGAVSIHASDLNGDGHLDIIPSFPGDLLWYSNEDGLGNFGEPIRITTGLLSIVSPVGGDIDSDGDTDVVTGSRFEGTIFWYENVETGSAWRQRKVASIPSLSILDVETADMDGDGDQDVIGILLEGLRWYENVDGRGAVFEEHILDHGQTVAGTAADMDSDGDLDLVGWVKDSVGWYENVDGQGTFGDFQPKVNHENKGDNALVTGDLDGDGDEDVVALSVFGRFMVWYENDRETNEFSRHEFAPRLAVSTSQPPTIVDLDQDGDLDVLYGTETFRNDGRGEFVSERTITGATRIAGVIDFDGDGDLDLVTRTNSSIRWRENIGPGLDRRSFVDRQELLRIGRDDLIVVADLDGRDRGNVLVALMDEDRLLWLESRTPGDVNSDGVFDSADLIAALQSGEYEDRVTGNSTFEEGDWDGDGDFTSADLVLAFQFGNYVGGPPTETPA